MGYQFVNVGLWHWSLCINKIKAGAPVAQCTGWVSGQLFSSTHHHGARPRVIHTAPLCSSCHSPGCNVLFQTVNQHFGDCNRSFRIQASLIRPAATSVIGSYEFIFLLCIKCMTLIQEYGSTFAPPDKYLNLVKGAGMHIFIPAVGCICRLKNIFSGSDRKGSWRKMCQRKKTHTVRECLVTKSWFPPQVSHFPRGPPSCCLSPPTPDATTQETAGWVNALTGANHAVLPSSLLFLLLAEAGQPLTCLQPPRGSQSHFRPTHLTPFAIPNCIMMLKIPPEDAFHWTKL